MASAAIFPAWDKALVVGRADLDAVIAAALSEPRRRARLCLHHGPEDAVQEMLIALAPGCYIRPLRQAGAEKSYVLVRGRLRLGFFGDGGDLDRVIDLAAGVDIAARFDATPWHTTVPVGGEVAAYVETIRGPYHPAGTEWAPWAADEGDSAGRQALLDRVMAAQAGSAMSAR